MNVNYGMKSPSTDPSSLHQLLLLDRSPNVKKMKWVLFKRLPVLDCIFGRYFRITPHDVGLNAFPSSYGQKSVFIT